MSNREQKKHRKLSREILGIFGITLAISVFFYCFLSVMADSLIQNYIYINGIAFTEMQEWTVKNWVQSLSFGAALMVFLIIFLFLTGQKLSYLNVIIQGIDSLHTQRMNYELPLEGDNELTELAESINFLAKAERELSQKEQEIREEKEALIRALSHDIRTPLTSILSYSEYMKEKDKIEKEEIREYIELMHQKANQIKGLTELLLDGGQRKTEYFEDARFLFYQLAEEWSEVLDEQFQCDIQILQLPEFSGNFDVQEMCRIFDNLASNVKKYADTESVVELKLEKEEECLVIKQRNKRRIETANVESYRIGLESIRGIVRNYGGSVETNITEEFFEIRICIGL